MTRLRPFCLVPLLWALSTTVAVAQLTSTDRVNLLNDIQSATQNLDPGRLPDLETATAQLLGRIDSLNEFLVKAADAENREAWLRYFDLDPLTQAIASQASASDLMDKATDVHDRLIGTSPGLEMAAVQRLRDALDGFIDALRFRNRDQSIGLLKSLLETLSELVENSDDHPSPDQFTAISARIALLESSGQTPELVARFRDVFSRPNVSIMIGSKLVAQAIDRPVTRERPVRDCILGTRLIGTALLKGDVSARLLPSTGTAQIHLTLVGNVVSNNTGYNGPVRLKTVGNGDVTATRTMTVDASGIDFGETSSQAALSTRILCIQHNLALVRAIARKQAAKQKPAADRIALERLRIQIGDQFSTETTGMSPLTPSELLARAEPMMKRLSLSQPTQNWSSTEDAICIDSVFRGPEQLSSIVPRPELPQSFSVAIQIHESAIENAFSVILAGRSLNERRLNELLEKTGRIKPETDDETSEPPFEISFSRSRPVIFEARGQTLRVGLRGTRFAQGERAPLVKAMEITAVYKPITRADGRAVLKRDGEVEVDFPRERLTLREVGLKPIIQKEFSEIFPEEILGDSLRIRDDAKVQTLRGREFWASLVDIVDGWLSIEFQ